MATAGATPVRRWYEAGSGQPAPPRPRPGPHQLAPAALVLAVVLTQPLAVLSVVRALAAVVGVPVRGAPVPEVACLARAAPAIAAVGTRGASPEGGERLRPVADLAALRARHPPWSLPVGRRAAGSVPDRIRIVHANGSRCDVANCLVPGCTAETFCLRQP